MVSWGTGRQVCDLGLPEHPGSFLEEVTRGLPVPSWGAEPLYSVKPGKKMGRKSGKVSQDKCLPRLSAMGGRATAPESP